MECRDLTCAGLEARVTELERRVAELAQVGAGAEWLRQAQAARVAGISAGTVRAWQAAGLLSRGRGGRVSVPELRRLLAGGERPAHVADLGAARARKAAAEILGTTRGGGGGA